MTMPFSNNAHDISATSPLGFMADPVEIASAPLVGFLTRETEAWTADIEYRMALSANPRVLDNDRRDRPWAL